MAGGIWLGEVASNTFDGLPTLNVEPDVWTGTRMSVIEASM